MSTRRIKMDRVTTPEFRASYANVFKSHAFEGQPAESAKYSIVMLFPKSTDLAGLKKLANDAIAKKWDDPAKRKQMTSNPNFKNPFRDGDVERADKEGYPGHIFISASSKMKPGIVDQNTQAIINEDNFYSGCYARATLTAYGYNTAGNIGVAFGLQNLQFLKDGDAFSGRNKAENDFGVVDTGASIEGDVTVSASTEDFLS